MSPIQQNYFNELKTVSPIEQKNLFEKGLKDETYDIEYIRKQAVDNKETQLVSSIDGVLATIVKDTIKSPCEKLEEPILGLGIKRVTIKNSYKSYLNLQLAIQNYYSSSDINIPKEKINLLKLNKLVNYVEQIMISLHYCCRQVQISNSSVFNDPELNIPLEYKGINRFFNESIVHKHPLNLDLSNKNLKVLHPDIFLLKSMTNLDLSNNKLEELPENLFSLNKLVILNLSQNLISNLSPSIKNLKSLEIFHISHNQLRSLPSEIGELKNLSVLTVSDNAIDSLPDSLVNLPRLYSLNITDNKVKTLPKDFHKLKNLNILYFSNNQFSTLPKSLKNLKLQTLKLKNNPLKFIFDEMLTAYRFNFSYFFRNLDWMKEFNEQFHQKLQSPLARFYHATLIGKDENTLKNYLDDLGETKSVFEQKLKEYKLRYFQLNPELTNLNTLKILIEERFNLLSHQNQELANTFIKHITGSQLNIKHDNVALLAEAVENISKLSEHFSNESMNIDIANHHEYQYSTPLIQNLLFLLQQNSLDERTVRLLLTTLEAFPQVEKKLNNENLRTEYPNILREILFELHASIAKNYDQRTFIEQFLIRNQINNLFINQFFIETIEDILNLEINQKLKVYDFILSLLK